MFSKEPASARGGFGVSKGFREGKSATGWHLLGGSGEGRLVYFVERRSIKEREEMPKVVGVNLL